MGEISIQPGTLTNYRDTTVQSGDTVYLGSGSYRIKLKLELPKSLKSLSASLRFRVNTGSALGTGKFLAAMTQTNGSSPPGTADAAFYFSWDSNRGGDFTITKRMKKGTWYLWIWYSFSGHQETLSGSRSNGYPIWSIGGVTAGGGHVFKGGEWKELTPKVYKNGAWVDAPARKYEKSWGELG